MNLSLDICRVLLRSRSQSSIRMSKSATRLSKNSSPLSEAQSYRTDFFPGLLYANRELFSPLGGPLRKGPTPLAQSPFGGRSIFMTSAPNAARKRPQWGPATPSASSSTLSPESADSDISPLIDLSLTFRFGLMVGQLFWAVGRVWRAWVARALQTYTQVVGFLWDLLNQQRLPYKLP